MSKQRIKINGYLRWIGYFLLGIIVIMSTIYGSLAWSEGESAVERVFI